MRVVAIDRFEYANKLRLPGDEFDTDNEDHARLLVLARRVKYLDDRSLTAEKSERKNRYARRDMRARE